MFKNAFPDGIGTTKKVAIVNIVLVANAFIWYFYAFNFLMDAVNVARLSNLLSDFEVLLIWGINFIGIAASAVFGVYLLNRLKQRMTLLRYWTFAGIILSLTPLALSATTAAAFVMVSTVLGVYFGIGMPICLGYYAATTETRNRARLGGITYLAIGLGYFVLRILAPTNIILNSIILASLRGIALFMLVLLKPDENQKAKEEVSYRSVISDRPFLLYFVPWLMFSLVNWLVAPINERFFTEDFIFDSTIIESIIAGIFAVAGGFFADSVGRKRLALIAFALLGMGYAGLGLFTGNLAGWWFYTLVDGIAWGVFNPIFLIIIWGYLGKNGSSEKYYIIGSLPFLLSIFMRLSVGAFVAEAMTKAASTLFSFASFFLFLAILPLIYAPETLPEKTMRDRELKNYIEKAQKEAEKVQ
jgi:hypothetical protein